VTISNGHELAKAVGENAVEHIPEAKYPDVIGLTPHMSDELRAELFRLIPGLLQFSLDAMKATEETLKTTLAANAQDQAELSASFSELQAIAKGRLDRDCISEKHEQFLFEYLMKLQDKRIESSRENKQFIAEEAAAARRTKVMQASLPILEMAIMAGVRILLTRGR
jgi:phosphoribosyl-ATP pyrophosphohydrolase